MIRGRAGLVGAGIVAAALATPAGRAAARRLLPSPQTRDRIGADARAFGAAVRAGMAEREAELRLALGLESPPLPPGARLDPEAVRELLRDPAGWRARQG